MKCRDRECANRAPNRSMIKRHIQSCTSDTFYRVDFYDNISEKLAALTLVLEAFRGTITENHSLSYTTTKTADPLGYLYVDEIYKLCYSVLPQKFSARLMKWRQQINWFVSAMDEYHYYRGQKFKTNIFVRCESLLPCAQNFMCEYSGRK